MTASPAVSSGVAAGQPAVETPQALKAWWTGFKKRSKKEAAAPAAAPDPQPSIFGVPLAVSIKYANVAISLVDENGQSFIYGYVPIVVAKCGVYLKEKATDVEGIFRLSGSAKRIKELQGAFDTPDRYGKGLDWTGYTVHDAANVLRRYLNLLPQPIVPLEFYERFRHPLRGHQSQAVGSAEPASPPPADAPPFSPETAIATYQQLITELPALNRQLLLYLLDLLAVFASKADINLMTAANLSAIFQPGILSHPDDAMVPAAYRLSQDVLIFLIDNQDSFLIGMSGTAADEQTMREVQDGPRPAAGVPATPARHSGGLPGHGPQGGLMRSASSASGGADRLRRNASASSQHSRQRSPNASPATPLGSFASPNSSSSVYRSNTVPSKKSPALGSSHSPRGFGESQANPSTLHPTLNESVHRSTSPQKPPLTTDFVATPTPASTSTTIAAPPSPSQQQAIGLGLASTRPKSPASEQAPSETFSGAAPSVLSGQSKEPLLVPAGDDSTLRAPPPKTRRVSDFLAKFPNATSDSEAKESRQPNKLKKRRGPPSTGAQQSAHSSQGSLSAALSGPDSPNVGPVRAPLSPVASPGSEMTPTGVAGTVGLDETVKHAATQPGTNGAGAHDASVLSKTDPTYATSSPAFGPQSPPQNATTAAPRPSSPSNSVNSRSSVTDLSEVDAGDGSARAKPRKRHFFRLGGRSRRSTDVQASGTSGSGSGSGSMSRPVVSPPLSASSVGRAAGGAGTPPTAPGRISGLSSTGNETRSRAVSGSDSLPPPPAMADVLRQSSVASTTSGAGSVPASPTTNKFSSLATPHAADKASHRPSSPHKGFFGSRDKDKSSSDAHKSPDKTKDRAGDKHKSPEKDKTSSLQHRSSDKEGDKDRSSEDSPESAEKKGGLLGKLRARVAHARSGPDSLSTPTATVTAGQTNVATGAGPASSSVPSAPSPPSLKTTAASASQTGAPHPVQAATPLVSSSETGAAPTAPSEGANTAASPTNSAGAVAATSYANANATA